MDESKPRTRKKTASLDSVDESVTPRPPASAHIIDLRQGGAKRPGLQPARNVRRPAPSQPKASAAAPVSEPTEAEELPSTPPSAPKRTASPAVQPMQPEFTDAAFATKNRFWPAFWRFLLLLVVLGVVTVGGAYAYLTFLRG